MDIERQSMEVDIACVGFGPAMGGFLTTLTRLLTSEDGLPVAESKAMPGMPPQIICYERADDIGFGVSGVVSRARSIRESFPDFNPAEVPMSANVAEEKMVYLFDPHGASRRPALLRAAEAGMKLFGREHAMELPWIPDFLNKHGGLAFSLGQFNQWVGADIMGSGHVQIWPGTPVAAPLVEDGRVTGVRLLDQGVSKRGEPEAGFMPGMDIKAALTVVGDGPVGPVGRALDDAFGLPPGNHRREWAVGMKMVVELPEGCDLKPGTVLHTLGYPEPEIFGFMYVLPENTASLGIFVPSWFDNPVRTAYRYLQHWMMHPYLWKWLSGGTLRSWAAKSLQEDGRKGEPYLAGDGYARIGEGSGSTNVLTGSGVDEAWATGVMLAESVAELLKADKPFTKRNLERTYVQRRRSGWLDRESRIAAKARDGFSREVVSGFLGMALSGVTEGGWNWPGKSRRVWERIPSVEEFFKGRIPRHEIERIRRDCEAKGLSLHDALMDRAGWARDSPGRQAPGLPPGRPAHGGQGAGQPGLRGPRGVRGPGPVRGLPYQDLHRGLLRPGHHRESGRRGFPCSIGKNASIAGPACGIAASRAPGTRKRPTSSSAPVRAGSIQLKTKQGKGDAMSGFHIVVCGSIVPDPLQTLEPVAGPAGPALKNEMMLPAVLDPWAGHALFEAANLAAKTGDSKVWLVSLGPKAKLQQVMMSIGQKVPFELVVLDGPASGFTDASEVAEALAGAIESIDGLDRERLLVFGGWQSASRGTGAVMQMVGERLGIMDQFQGVDELAVLDGGAFQVKERIEGGSYLISECAGAPAVLGWATGNLPEPPNNPQVGMANMRLIMPALQKAKPAPVGAKGRGVQVRGPARWTPGDPHRQGRAPGRHGPGNRGLDQAVDRLSKDTDHGKNPFSGPSRE